MAERVTDQTDWRMEHVDPLSQRNRVQEQLACVNAHLVLLERQWDELSQQQLALSTGQQGHIQALVCDLADSSRLLEAVVGCLALTNPKE